MKVRNIARKAAVLGSAVTMLGATVMGAMAYNLADYPTKYIADGKFVGEIVVGEKAATSDVLGAVDIAASLQAGSVTKEEVKIPGKVGEVDLGENSFKFETSNDMLEIREAMGNIFESLTDSELPALAGGKITTDQGTTDYDQYLTFDDGTGATLQAIGVNYLENKDDVIADYLVIDDGLSFFQWQIDFPDGLTSEFDTATLELTDLEDETFNIFGTEFTFVDSSYDSTANDITLSFMTGDVTDTLREGETKTYTLDGVDYEITAVFISDPSNNDPAAKFSVNGELTDSLGDGETEILSNGVQIGVRDLLVNSRDGIVQFFLGANKIEFTDTDYTATTTSGTVEIGVEEINDVDLQIDVTEGSGEATINSITYKLSSNPSSSGGILYIPAGKGVREFVDEPEALLSPTFDIRYEGLTVVPTNDIDFASSGDDVYMLTATNMQSNEFSWPVFGARSDVLYYGDDEDDFIFYESNDHHVDVAGTTLATIQAGIDAVPAANRTSVFNIDLDDYFLLTDSTKADYKQVGVIMQYDSINEDEEEITFVDVSTGQPKTEQFTATGNVTGSSGYVRGYGDINVGGNTYWFWILDDETTDFPIAFDVNGDSDLSLTNNEATFTAKGGVVIDFNAAIGEDIDDVDDGIIGNEANISLTTDETLFDTMGRDEVLLFKVTESAAETDQLDINTNVNWWTSPHYLGNSTFSGGYRDWQMLSARNSDVSNTYTGFGAFVELDDTDDVSTLLIKYPESQVGAQVFVVAGTTEKTTTSGGAVLRDVVNPIAVGLAVLDVDTSLYAANQIIVGGPCANAVAAAFMDSPVNCAEGFEAGKAMIVAKESAGKVAILVAGYEAKETLGASYVLADYKTYLKDVKAAEVEVVASDLSDLKVMAPE